MRSVRIRRFRITPVLGEDYEAGAVLVLNPVDPDSPEAAAGKTHVPELFVAPRANHYTQDFFMNAHYGEYWVGPRAGLQEMTAMTGIETNDIAQLADALSRMSVLKLVPCVCV